MTSPVTREQMISLDRWAIQTIGIPGVVLMENAGRAVADHVPDPSPAPDSGPVLVVSGKGNNGGDGFVIARHLWNRKRPVTVRVLGDLEQYPAGTDARIQLDILLRLGIDVARLDGDRLPPALARPQLIVDALFGTGLTGAPRSPADRLIEDLNVWRERGVPIVAVDIPSGLDCNTGETPGAAIRADQTVTFARMKHGFLRNRGPDHTGRVTVADIGIPIAGPHRPLP